MHRHTTVRHHDLIRTVQLAHRAKVRALEHLRELTRCTTCHGRPKAWLRCRSHFCQPAEYHAGTVTGHASTLAGLASAACLSARLQSNCWLHQPYAKVPGSPIRRRRRRHRGRTAPWRTGHCRLRHRCRIGGRTGSAGHATAPFTRHSASRCLSNVSSAVPGRCSRVAARSALCGPCWKE
jgi:hypothetical protein